MSVPSPSLESLPQELVLPRHSPGLGWGTQRVDVWMVLGDPLFVPTPLRTFRPLLPLGVRYGSPSGSRGLLFFVAVSEGMWRGLGGGGGRVPTQSGGRGFARLLHLCSSASEGGARLPRAGGRYQPLSTDLDPHVSHHPFPSSKHHPLVGSFFRNPEAAQWELRPSPFESLLSPLFALGSPRPRSPDVSVGSDCGNPPSPRPYPSNASTSHPLEDRCLGSRC